MAGKLVADVTGASGESSPGIFLRRNSLAIYDLRWTCNCAREERQWQGTHKNLISRRDWDGRAETAIDVGISSRIFDEPIRQRDALLRGGVFGDDHLLPQWRLPLQ